MWKSPKMRSEAFEAPREDEEKIDLRTFYDIVHVVIGIVHSIVAYCLAL